MKILEVQKLKKSFRRNKQIVEAVRDVSLTMFPGEILAFLGPNGAGKTTSIKMERKYIHINQLELLYQAFDILNPLSIQIVEKEQADLTEIFLQIIREERNRNA